MIEISHMCEDRRFILSSLHLSGVLGYISMLTTLPYKAIFFTDVGLNGIRLCVGLFFFCCIPEFPFDLSLIKSCFDFANR